MDPTVYAANKVEKRIIAYLLSSYLSLSCISQLGVLRWLKCEMNLKENWNNYSLGINERVSLYYVSHSRLHTCI